MALADFPQSSPRTPNKSTLVAYLCLALLGLIAVLPFLQPYHLLPLTSLHSEWIAFALGLAACSAFLLRDFWEKLLIPKIVLPLLGLLGLMVVQGFVLTQAYIAQALIPALYLCWAIALIILTAWLRTALGIERIIVILAWFILFGGALQASVGVIQYFDNTSGWITGWVAVKHSNTIYGNIGQSNHFATQITLATLALIYLFASSRLSTYPASVLLVVFVLVLMLSSSRSVGVYATAVFVLSLLTYRKTRELFHFRFAVASGLLLLLFLLSQYFAHYINDSLNALATALGFGSSRLELLTALDRGAGSAVNVRVWEWRKAWHMFLQNPITGVGVGNYGWFSFVYQSLPEFAAAPKAQLFRHSHNIFMQVLAELGIVGISLIVIALFGWLKHFLTGWTSPANSFIASCLLVLFIHSNLEYPLWYSFFLGPAAVFLSLGDTRVLQGRFTPRLGQLMTVMSLFFAVMILFATLRGFNRLTDVNAMVLTSSPEKAASTLNSISKNKLLTPWAEAAMAAHGHPSRKRIDQQLELTTRVMLYQPNAFKVNRQVIYLALAGRSEEALTLLNLSAIAYEMHLPQFVCAMRAMTYPEISPLLRTAEKLLDVPPPCSVPESDTRIGSSLIER